MDKSNRAIKWYLIIIAVFCYGLGIAEMIFHTGRFYDILQVGFTLFPVVTTFLVCGIIKEKKQTRLSLKVWKNWKMWLFSAFVPAVAIALGVILYFSVFYSEFSGVFQIGKLIGGNEKIVISNPFTFALVCIVISAVCIPIQLLELGEEVGWRGFLLWHQVDKYGAKKAVLINGVEWGLAHMPLIYFGFNYSNDNFGAPWSNMVLMMLLCIVLGVVFSFVTLKTGNCMYAAIMHGVVNVIGEIPVYCSISLKSGLLGPNPTGLFSMSLLIVLAVILFVRLDKLKISTNTK